MLPPTPIPQNKLEPSLTDKLREFLANVLRMRLITPAKEVFTAQSEIKRLINEFMQPDTNGIALELFFERLASAHAANDTEQSGADAQQQNGSEPKAAAAAAAAPTMADSHCMEMDVDMHSPVPVQPAPSTSKSSMELGTDEESSTRKRKLADDDILADGQQSPKKLKLPSTAGMVIVNYGLLL